MRGVGPAHSGFEEGDLHLFCNGRFGSAALPTDSLGDTRVSPERHRQDNKRNEWP